MAIAPYTIDDWIRAALMANSDVATFCSGRIHVLRDDIEPDGWPFIVFAGDSDYTHWADEILLERGEFRVYGVTRQDKISGYSDIEDVLALLYAPLVAALEQSAIVDVATGRVHGCQVIKPWKRFYGEPYKKVAELGVVVRIVAT